LTNKQHPSTGVSKWAIRRGQHRCPGCVFELSGTHRVEDPRAKTTAPSAGNSAKQAMGQSPGPTPTRAPGQPGRPILEQAIDGTQVRSPHYRRKAAKKKKRFERCRWSPIAGAGVTLHGAADGLRPFCRRFSAILGSEFQYSQTTRTAQSRIGLGRSIYVLYPKKKEWTDISRLGLAVENRRMEQRPSRLVAGRGRFGKSWGRC